MPAVHLPAEGLLHKQCPAAISAIVTKRRIVSLIAHGRFRREADLRGRLASSAGNFVSRSGAANATGRAVFGGRRRVARLADASGGS